MNKNIQIGLVIYALLCFCACGNKRYPQPLLMADSLIYIQPDSAIALLESLKNSMRDQTKDVQIYYQLLSIKANDKAYIPNTSDSLILPVLRYYEMKKDKRHLPETYYYAGRVYRDLGNAPQALEFFEKAIEAAKEGDNCRLKSAIYSQIGTLLTYQGIGDEALNTFRKAFQCDKILEDSFSMAFDLHDIAWAYRQNDQMDSALHYYKVAYGLAKTTQHQDLMNLIQSQMASIYNQLKKYDLAKKALQASLNNLDPPSKSGIYSIASELYHETGKTDSATYYYNELLTCGTIFAKQAAHQGLARIAIEKSRPKEALLHLQHYVQCTDSIQKITNAETIRKMHTLYNYNVREKENKQLKIKNEQNRQFIIHILTICIILAALLLALFQYYKRKKLQLIMQLEKLETIKNEQYKKSVQYIVENNNKIKELEEKLEYADKRNETIKKQLQKQKDVMIYTNKQLEIGIEEREQAQINLFNSDIYTHFKGLIHSSPQKRPTAKDWVQLETAINNAYKGFTDTLTKLHGISQYELHVSLLIKINIQPVDIAFLTAHSKESVSATRRRLYEKVFQAKGAPKDWDEFILSL